MHSRVSVTGGFNVIVPYYAMMFGYLFQWNISHETLTSIFCLGKEILVVHFGHDLRFATLDESNIRNPRQVPMHIAKSATVHWDEQGNHVD